MVYGSDSIDGSRGTMGEGGVECFLLYGRCQIFEMEKWFDDKRYPRWSMTLFLSTTVCFL